MNSKKTCVWKYEEHKESWKTGCEQRFQFSYDGPKQNGFTFCPYCGLKITTSKAL
jgi:hypothetical protein